MIGETTLDDYLTALASKKSTPGGGAVAGVDGAQAAALIAMAARLTRGNPDGLEDAIESAVGAQTRFLQLADEDMRCFEDVMSAWKQASASTADEKKAPRARLESSLKAAASVPLEMIRLTGTLIPSLSLLIEVGNRNLITDVGIAARLCESVILSSRLNVIVNLKSIEDRQFVEATRKALESIPDTVKQIAEINAEVDTILNEE